jgi:hypothetical protein
MQSVPFLGGVLWTKSNAMVEAEDNFSPLAYQMYCDRATFALKSLLLLISGMELARDRCKLAIFVGVNRLASSSFELRCLPKGIKLI